ncbi:MAG: hypothetical protein ACLVJH_17800 [Faecalibacterium prausnitzii]
MTCCCRACWPTTPSLAEDIARLGEGGLCLSCAECHWPNCGFGHC